MGTARAPVAVAWTLTPSRDGSLGGGAAASWTEDVAPTTLVWLNQDTTAPKIFCEAASEKWYPS